VLFQRRPYGTKNGDIPPQFARIRSEWPAAVQSAARQAEARGTDSATKKIQYDQGDDPDKANRI